jgi:hypothetical protein
MSTENAPRRRRTGRRLVWLAVAGAVGGLAFRALRRRRSTQIGAGGPGALSVTETITTAVGADGTVVVDDLVVVADDTGAVVAADETIAVETPDGTVVSDEVVSVVDDRGHLVTIAEEASITTTDATTDR